MSVKLYCDCFFFTVKRHFIWMGWESGVKYTLHSVTGMPHHDQEFTVS